jgi:hypothetical protein
MAKTIVVEITYDDPEDPEAFKGRFPLDALAIWSALGRAFPYTRGGDWTVRELELGSDVHAHHFATRGKLAGGG